MINTYFAIIICGMILFLLPFAIYDLRTYSRYHNSVIKDALIWLFSGICLGYLVGCAGMLQYWILSNPP